MTFSPVLCEIMRVRVDNDYMCPNASGSSYPDITEVTIIKSTATFGVCFLFCGNPEGLNCGKGGTLIGENRVSTIVTRFALYTFSAGQLVTCNDSNSRPKYSDAFKKMMND